MPNARVLQKRLRTARNAYGSGAQREQHAILTALRGMPSASWRELAALHDDLLFLCAFPGSLRVRRLARRFCRELGERVGRLPRAQRIMLDDSGIAGSVTRHVFPLPVARWLARVAPTTAEIDWRSFDDPALLDAFVSALLCDAEREAFDSGEFGTNAWIRLARRAGVASDLQWLTETAAATPTADRLVEERWDDAQVPVAWRIGESHWSVTHNMIASAPVALRRGMRRPPADTVAEIQRPLTSIERLDRRHARRVADTARAALAARCREVNAMSYPNLDEIWWCDLGEGVALAVIGIAPERRLTLETNTGYVLFANGVPIGYGGVTPLFRQANTGINIFDAFRGGEAAFLWTQMLRAFHTLYGSRRFVINAYQFGAGNAEAIASGAYWFYYRLGFRPAGAAARKLAAREAQHLAENRAYRSSAATLRALAEGDLHLDLPGFTPDDHFDEALLPRAGALAAMTIARESAWSRAQAAKTIAERLAGDLAIDDFARWSPRERRGFTLLAPVVAGIPGLPGWSAADRAAAAAMLRAKGALQERGFARKSLRAEHLFRALHSVLGSVA